MPVKASSSIERLQVVADADGVTSRAGTALIAGVADRVGLTAGLSDALESLRERRSRHDPGRVVRDLALTLADGGDCLADLRALRDQEPLFADVASDATAWRALAALDERRLQAIRVARARARGRVWERVGAARRVILDIDGTLVTAHSDKEGAAGRGVRKLGPGRRTGRSAGETELMRSTGFRVPRPPAGVTDHHRPSAHRPEISLAVVPDG